MKSNFIMHGKSRKNDDIFKKMLSKKYNLPPRFKSHVFADKMFDYCSDSLKRPILNKQRFYIINRVFRTGFEKEIAQNCDRLQKLSNYEKKFVFLDPHVEFVKLEPSDQVEFAHYVKQFIEIVFPLVTIDHQLFYSRLVLIALVIPKSEEKQWIDHI